MAGSILEGALPKAIIGEIHCDSGRACRYGMFARHGGASGEPYTSLNVGVYVGDDPEAVAVNRQRVRQALDIPRLLTARQVHGRGVYCLTEPIGSDLEVDGFDALVTNLPGIGLAIQQADCQAVLLLDPRREVIAAIHCGWRGSVLGLVPEVVAVMTGNYGTEASDLRAIISPSLGPCCAEFVNYRSELPVDFQQFMVSDTSFDFWQITKAQLSAAGVAEAHIETTGRCTCCSDDYFSYRRATRQNSGITGRNCSVIALERKSS
ncbi:MAG: peptidoglycan editing factor PgeF [Desulforhopalus sp.]|nr:peptidoglycan editing factor PgeF [Desulforhopalus sp.]